MHADTMNNNEQGQQKTDLEKTRISPWGLWNDPLKLVLPSLADPEHT